MSAYDAMLNATCTIQRRGITGSRDPQGQDTGEFSYSDLATGVPCRLDGVGWKPLKEQDDAVSATHRIFMPTGTDIRHTDRVKDVTLDGAVLLALADVESVDLTPGGMRHHVEVMLLQVQ